MKHMYKMNAKLSKIYYSPKGYWKGLTAIKKLSEVAKVSEVDTKRWLEKQAIWQIYLPAPRRIPRQKFNIRIPNEVHQADLLFLPHDKVGRKKYKYALTIVDVASRYKEAEPLTTKNSSEVADALAKIYRRSPLTWPKLLQVDPGREFMGDTKRLLDRHGVKTRLGRVNVHRDQGIVERFNRTLAERLFGYQYAQEMKEGMTSSGDVRSTEWVKRLSDVIHALNSEETRLIGKKPIDAIRLKNITQTSSSTIPGRAVGLDEKKLSDDIVVRYLYLPGELEGGGRRATDPIWSLKFYKIDRSVTKPNEPVLYYLRDGPQRWFIREELLIVPFDTQLPP